MLTPRDLRRISKRPRRIILDPALRIHAEAHVVRTAREWPTTIVHIKSNAPAMRESARRLVSDGVDLLAVDPSQTMTDEQGVHIRLDAALGQLREAYGLTTVLVEAGRGLVSRLLAGEGLVDECIVYLAPKLVGDEAALPIWSGRLIESMDHALPLTLRRARRLGDDLELIYRPRISADDASRDHHSS